MKIGYFVELGESPAMHKLQAIGGTPKGRKVHWENITTGSRFWSTRHFAPSSTEREACISALSRLFFKAYFYKPGALVEPKREYVEAILDLIPATNAQPEQQVAWLPELAEWM